MQRHAIPFLPAALLALLLAGFLAAPLRAIEIVSSSMPGEQTLAPGGQVSFEVVVGGTDEVVNTSYDYRVWIQGSDFYGNAIYVPVDAGVVILRGEVVADPGPPPVVTQPTTAKITGVANIPADGTLAGGYKLYVAIYLANGSGAEAEVATYTADGGIDTFTVTSPGSEYNYPPYVYITIHSVINRCACQTLQSLRRTSALFVQLLYTAS